jgi:hypothetical protein
MSLFNPDGTAKPGLAAMQDALHASRTRP